MKLLEIELPGPQELAEDSPDSVSVAPPLAQGKSTVAREFFSDEKAAPNLTICTKIDVDVRNNITEIASHLLTNIFTMLGSEAGRSKDVTTRPHCSRMLTHSPSLTDWQIIIYLVTWLTWC